MSDMLSRLCNAESELRSDWQAEACPTLLEQGQRVHSRPLPPMFLGTELKDREVQVWRIPGRIAGGPDVTQHIAFAQQHPLFQSQTIAIQVRIVVAPGSGIVELVHRQTSRLAGE